MKQIKVQLLALATTRKFLPLILLISLIILAVHGHTVTTYASENSEEIPHVYDLAGLLSTEEIKKLEEMCITYGEEAGIEILILTHDDPNAKEPEKYLEDFNDTLPEADRILLLIDMQERFIWMQGYGLAESYLHSRRLDSIAEEMSKPMANGNYAKAFEIYIKTSAAYMKDDTELNWDHDYSVSSPKPGDIYYDTYNKVTNETEDMFTSWWFQLIISLAVGVIVVLIMSYHSSGRMTAGSHTYMDQSRSGLIGRRDQYLHTRVTRVRRPKDNNSSTGGFNSGGYRGGVSSGGRSHSSGGGRF